ncbi:RHS repeat-associated protein [Pseudomonas sp. Y3 TE3536]
MTRFSEIFVNGYNKSVIDGSDLKRGDPICVNGDKCWFIAAHDTHIEVLYRDDFSESAAQDCCDILNYDNSEVGLNVIHTISGVEREKVSRYSQNEPKYRGLEQQFKRKLFAMLSSGAYRIIFDDPALLSASSLPVLIELHPASVKDFVTTFGSDACTDTYGLLCYLDAVEPHPASVESLIISMDDAFGELRNDLASEYSFVDHFLSPPSDTPIQVNMQHVRAVYSLSDVAKLAPLMEALSASKAEAPTALPIIDAKQTFPVPYKITNQTDGTMPDMQGFGLERVGSAEGGWYSLCPIKADRALAAGETVSACLVHRRTGELTHVDYTAQASKLGTKQWLKDFTKYVAEAGKPITAGGWSDNNAFSSSHEDPRLWCQADYRAFSTAPFDNNLVQVLACHDDFPLARGQTLSLQVRDLKTQALHEQHLFTAKAASGWAKALCEQVNRDSRLLRAGVKGAGCTVVPGEVNNAFWGPQCAELCVTVTEVNWWASRMFDGTKAVPDGGVLHAWVYDTFSQRLLGHHEWTPSSSQRASGKWLKAWAEALATSAVAPYLRVNTTAAVLEQRGDALRIFARLPDDDYDVEGPLLAPAFKALEDAVLVTVRHPGNQALLHHALFRPQACVPVPSNEQAWLQALARFIETQHWPELYVKDGRQLWLSRHAELLVALDNVGDGSEWATEDYRRELLNADEWPYQEAADPVAFTIEPGEGMTGVTISSLDAELEFRLDKAARDKGYRVMACMPRQAAAKQLREAYISYVDATLKAGNTVAVSFAETGASTAAVQVADSVSLGNQFSTVETALKALIQTAAFQAADEATFATAYEAAVKSIPAVADNYVRKRIGVASMAGALVDREEYYSRFYGYSVVRSDALLAAAKLAFAIAVAHKEATAVWPVSVTGDTITWQGPLTNQAYDLYLDCPESERGKEALTVGHIGALGTTQFWHDPKPVTFTPPKALKVQTDISYLCEDYGNTSRSELFDTTGHGEAGVDPRTGLFHAHYLVASLQGLQGQGPAVDLTLHYSALRANEAGLGDGWAWRFSSVDVRDRRLTLADGAQIKFNEAQWKDLGAEKAIKLASCVVRSNADYSKFTLDLPSGRQEILEKPAVKGSDEEEPNKELHGLLLKTLKAIRDKSRPGFPVLPDKWQQWIAWAAVPRCYYVAADLDYDRAVNAWEGEKAIIELKKRIADLELELARLEPFVLLVPSSIESPYGEKLTLEWKREKGQFLLLTVKSGEEALFMAEYETPQGKAAKVNMQVWPQSNSEKYEVRLELKDYLLRTLKRVVKVKDKDVVLQQVDCDYDDDYTLDRVLCGLRELDGSVECVRYQPWQPKNEEQKNGRPGLPRVAIHTLVPGDGQQNQVATYRYEGDFLRTDQRIVTVEYEYGPHGAREQHLLVQGNVKHSGYVERFELLRAVASKHGHWLAFATRQNENKSSKQRVTKGYRYTGAGDEYAKLLYAIEAGAGSEDIKVKDGAELVERQRELLEWFFSKTDDHHRPKIAACITRLVASAPHSEREALGRTVAVATQEEDMAGNVQRLHKTGEDSLYRCYYTKPGDNPFTVEFDERGLSGELKSVPGLEGLPTLQCPFIPEHASAPVMAEYQCDLFGNLKGLRLFGYRKVTRGSRDLLELAEVVEVEGVKGTLVGDWLNAKATWTLANSPAKLLWRQRSTEISLVSRKEGSTVDKWSVKDTQTTHLGEKQFKLENLQSFEDNPNNKGIVVRVTCTTEAGSKQFSKEVRSRHCRRLLEQVKQGEEVHWQYDALGRVTQETRYALKKGSNGLYMSKVKGQIPDERTDTTYSDDGKQATHTYANNNVARSYLDGLRRVWRHEWRRAGSQHFVPLDQYSLQGPIARKLLASCEWDYLPGGQAVVAMTPMPIAVGPQAWVREQGGLDGPGIRSLLQAQSEEKVDDEGGAAFDPFAFEPYATQDLSSQRLVEEGIDEQCVLKRTSDYTYRKDGTFDQVERVTDSAGKAYLQVLKRFDNSGDVIGYERTVDKETCQYSLERDALGRVTRITRPDNSTVEHSYHGLSNHATELKVNGQVVATQKVKNASTLTSRTVGSRAYSITDDTVTLPDKTLLTTLRSAEGQSFKAKDQALSSFTEHDGTQTLASPVGDAKMEVGWAQVQGSTALPGRQWVKQTSPRAKRQGHRWLSLRGRPLATLRADGHWQRVFTDEQGRVLRTCQDHEEVVHRYDALGRLQSRQAQALKAGGQWQVLSEHDSFGQEVTRRFLRNGSECFKQCLTWRGDGRLASKTSYEHGRQVRIERFTYDMLDRLQRYDCEALAAEHCPKDAQDNAVKAQEFTWDALSNLTRCVTTGFDGKTQTEELAYGTTSDPTRLTGISRGQDKRELTWNTNGYLTDAAGQHRFSYNGAGQLDKVCDSDGNVLARYEYDGSQRLAAQYLKCDESTCELRYDGDELIGEIHYDKDDKVSRTTSLSSGLAQYDGNEVRWLIDDPQVGVAGQVKNGSLELAPLLPFGEGTALEGLVNGYNGMRRDPLTGHYHAGNGYRSYDPALRRYAQPDWLSPFGEGGLNDYAHCPDPVNLHDPSGAIMLSRWGQDHQRATYDKAVADTEKTQVGGRWRGLLFSALVAVVGAVLTVVTGGLAAPLLAFVMVMSVLSFAFEVAAVFTEESNPELSRALSIASVATGVLSTLGFVGLFKLGFKGLQLLWKGAKALGSGLKVAWNGAKSMKDMVVKGLARVGRTGRVTPVGAGPISRVADDVLGSLSRPTGAALDRVSRPIGSLRGIWRSVRNHLGGFDDSSSMTNFANSGWLGKIGEQLQVSRHFQPLIQVRMSRGVSYAANFVGTMLDGNVLRGTVGSSIDLEASRLAALEPNSGQLAQRPTPSVRNSGSYSIKQLVTVPILAAVKQHRLPPVGHRPTFW